MILAQYPRKQSTATFVRQSRPSLGTCKIPGRTEEIQSFADRKDMKKFHEALKTIYNPKSSGVTTLPSTDGITLQTGKRGYLEKVGRTLY